MLVMRKVATCLISDQRKRVVKCKKLLVAILGGKMSNSGEFRPLSRNFLGRPCGDLRPMKLEFFC